MCASAFTSSIWTGGSDINACTETLLLCAVWGRAVNCREMILRQLDKPDTDTNRACDWR